MPLRVETLRGLDVQRHLAGLAKLRIEVFREWPYLYDGSLDYENEYLRAFANAPGAAIIGAFHGATLIGASTVAPLAAQADYVLAPFLAKGLDPEDYYYFGESVLKRAYRDRGLGVQFFAAREAVAREQPKTRTCVFCAVVRSEDDARKPPDYRPLDGFWRRRGYEPWAGMTCFIQWLEVGARQDSAQQMQFWRKELT